MLYYEIKKVFSRTINRAVLVVLAVVLAAATVMALRLTYWVNDAGESEYGIGAIQKMAEAQHAWAGPLTEERIAEVLEENARINRSPQAQSEDIQQNDIAYGWGQGIAGIRDLINCSFSPFYQYDYYAADALTAADAADFYGNRMVRLEEWLSTKTFSDAEEQYLAEKYNELETPLNYDYVGSWDGFFQGVVTVQMFLAMLLGFLVSGIFSGEIQTKADAVFFAAQHGRGKAIRAKLLAGFCIVSVLYWVVFLVYTVLVLGWTGFMGADCMLQVLEWRSFYNITIGQEYWLVAFGGYLGCLFLSSLAMLVSAKTHSTVLAALVSFVAVFIPSFLANQIDRPLMDKIVGLLPDQLLQLHFLTSRFKLYSVGGTVVGSAVLLFVLYTALTLLLQPALYASFRRQEVR